MTKKFFSGVMPLCLTLILIISSLTVSLAADNGDYQTSNASGGVCVDKYLSDEKEVSIPETINGRKVVAVGMSAFEGNETLESVNIPSTVGDIGTSAFSGCKALKSVTFAGSVKRIGSFAFSDCTALESISVPAQEIGYGAFSGCTALADIKFGDNVNTVGRFALEDTKWLASQEPGVVYAGNAAYSYISGADDTDVVLKDTTVSVSPYAFAGHDEITSVFIPSSVTAIGEYAFRDCRGLSFMHIPESVSSIGSYAVGFVTSDDGFSVNDEFTVYCFSASKAFTYCNSNSVKYETVDNCKHDPDSKKGYVVITAVSCEQDGLMRYTCAKCHYTEDMTVNKLGHKWSAWETVSEVGCETDGVKQRKCSVCGKTEKNTTPATGHTWSEWEIAKSETCDAPGETQRVCSVCGKTESQEIAPFGHTWSEWVVTKEATCKSKGERQRYCTVCSANETDVIPVSDEHKWGEWTVVKPATLTEEGLKQRQCSVCNKTEDQTIPVMTEEEPVLELKLKDTSVINMNKETHLISGIAAGSTAKGVLSQFIDYTKGEMPVVVNMKTSETVADGELAATGYAVVLVYDNKIVDYCYIVVSGDGDSNGKLTAADARLALRISAKLEAADAATLAALDLNGDGKISASEARTILRVSAKLEKFDGGALLDVSVPEEDSSVPVKRPEEESSSQSN